MIKNLTPHAVVYRPAAGVDITIPSSGIEARVTSTPVEAAPVEVETGIEAPAIANVWGNVENMPDPEPGTTYVVSALVLAHPDVAHRTDVVAPGTGPLDNPVRQPDKLPDGSPNPRRGQIVAVTRFVRPAAATRKGS